MFTLLVGTFGHKVTKATMFTLFFFFSESVPIQLSNRTFQKI